MNNSLRIAGLLPPGSRPVVDHLDCKVGQWIRPWQGEVQADAFLLGIPLSKTSISFSGAHETPQRFREVFGSFQAYHAEKDFDLTTRTLLDAGDVQMHITDLALCRRRIEEVAAALLAALPQALPIVIGGDHGITAPLLRAVRQNRPGEKIGVVQFDAHHDIRNLEDGGASNGTPFRQLLEEGVIDGSNLFQIGIRNFSNSRAYTEAAKRFGIHVVPMGRVQREGVAAVVEEAVASLVEGVDGIHVSLDLDVLDQAFAPGVPALGPGGMTTWQLVEAVERLAREPKVIGIDFVCIDATRDPRLMTTRVAAFALLHFLAERWQRLGDR